MQQDLETADGSVRIDERLLSRIGVREWGLPSCVTPGQIWRSERWGTVSCMVHDSPSVVRTETRSLCVVPAGESQWMPDLWREAIWDYVLRFPSSGCRYGPFLAISEDLRCQFIRELAKDLVESDDIGCRVIAHGIGQFAAYEYELPSVKTHAGK